MKPDPRFITINDNQNQALRFLTQMVLNPRVEMLRWASITNQTAAIKIGYTGQHLASLITGIPGTATGARGDDIADGTEVKSCSRIDQVDTCKKCKSHVMREQPCCPRCGSQNIDRKDDSKWLFAIRSESELSMYLNQIPRTLLFLADYPNFDTGDFSVLRFSTFEIWNQSERATAFRQLLDDYYHKIYLAHIAANPKKTPAPKNFWPYSYQFYLCNPIKTFECIVTNANSHPCPHVTTFIDPHEDRSNIPSEAMPASLLHQEEIDILKRQGVSVAIDGAIDETVRQFLPLRDTSEAKPQNRQYKRGGGSLLL